MLNLGGRVVGMTRSALVYTGSEERIIGTFYAVDWGEIRDALPNLKRKCTDLIPRLQANTLSFTVAIW